jgi:hypothetical protein
MTIEDWHINFKKETDKGKLEQESKLDKMVEVLPA